jgi:hypothetical protein
VRVGFERVERHVRRARGNTRAALQLAINPTRVQRERATENAMVATLSWLRAAIEILEWLNR